MKSSSMDIIFDFDDIRDSYKQDWLPLALKLMGIAFNMAKRP
jgi:hypothetical protein